MKFYSLSYHVINVQVSVITIYECGTRKDLSILSLLSSYCLTIIARIVVATITYICIVSAPTLHRFSVHSTAHHIPSHTPLNILPSIPTLECILLISLSFVPTPRHSSSTNAPLGLEISLLVLIPEFLA